MLVLIVSWSVSIGTEGNGIKKRYVASIIGFVCAAATVAALFVSQRMTPRYVTFAVIEALAAVTLFLTAVSLGMDDVVVSLCSKGTQLPNTNCGSHITELVAEVTLSVCMCIVYLASQQRIVMLIDKGIIDGIKGRTNGMQQLP
jgi:uncharacterized membrane protein